MKFERKNKHCLNCERPLTLSDNFCPNCGQENLTNRFSFGILAYDFFNNYFSFDSRLGRSIWPFLTRPGYLTKQFIAGKRVNFVHPLRLYLILSFLFFLVFSFWAGTVTKFNKKTKAIKQSELGAGSSNEPTQDQDYILTQDSTSFFGLLGDETLTDQQVMDSLKIESNTDGMGQLFIRQGRRILKQGPEHFVPYVAKNVSILIFIMLPLFALIMWIGFKRSEPFYIAHIVHGLHLHSVVFLLNLIVLLIAIFFKLQLWGVAFALYTIYCYLSIRNVYGQSYGRTLWKFLLLGIAYLLLLSLGAFAEVVISFLLY